MSFRTTACSCLAIAACTLLPGPVARAGALDTPLDSLTAAERVTLREGRPTLTKISEGQYVARILVRAPLETTWSVLTDYENFDEFLPNVVSAEIVSDNGTEKMVEQVNVGKVLAFSQKARTLSAIAEMPLQKIAFRLVEGDLAVSEGSWTLEQFAPHLGAPADRVLITYTITIDPGKTFSRSLFFNVFEGAIADTLSAVATEIDNRSN